MFTVATESSHGVKITHTHHCDISKQGLEMEALNVIY